MVVCAGRAVAIIARFARPLRVAARMMLCVARKAAIQIGAFSMPMVASLRGTKSTFYGNIKVQLSNKQILARAAELYDQYGYVHIKDLAKSLNYNYNSMYKRIDRLRSKLIWKYKKNTHKNIDYSNTLFEKVKCLYHQDNTITASKVRAAMGLSRQHDQTVKNYLCYIRRGGRYK